MREARNLMNDLVGRGVKPNAYTFNALIDAYIEKSDTEGVEEIVAVMEKVEVDFDVATYCLLIKWHAKCFRIEDALKVFDEMIERGVPPNIHVYEND